MSKILIIGNSLAVAQKIEEIRQNDQQSEIALFCTESVLPYDRTLLSSFVAGDIKEAQTHPLAADFFKQHKVDVIANEKLLRISLKRRYVTTENKTQIDFDQLMIADLGVLAAAPIKGHQKKGNFNCAMLNSAKDLIKYLPFTDIAFVLVTNIHGFNMACALQALGKEVVLICSGSTLLSEIFDEETGTLLKQIVEAKGLRVITDNGIEEILGDSEIKAVKLQSGKVMAAQMVITDASPLDWRLIEDETSGYQKIEDDFFKTGLPLKSSRFGLKILEGFGMGMTKLPDGGREYLKFDGPQNIFKKIFAKGDVLVGTVLFNSPDHEEQLSKTIAEGVSVVGQEEALLGG